uniref:ShKT domain-containing protein n=1 Tax=Meloidogyne hapla TaxID=6305 RepID=A0A1I8B601_MELHA
MINMIVGQQGMGGFGGMGQQGMGIPGGMGGFGGMNGIGGMGGFGGINGIGGIGGGGMNGIGGIGGGIGFPFGCTDFDPSCRYFVSYCFLESISEACMTSCGICSMSSGNMFGANGLGGAMGNYGRFGNAVMGKRK